MNRIVVNRSIREQLSDLQDDLELCDESGRILGYFMPAVDKSMYVGMDAPISDEELRRRMAIGGGRTLTEIMNDLNRQ